MPFLTFQRDHLRSIPGHLRCNLGIICSRGSFAALYSPLRRFVFQTEKSGKYIVLVLISRLFYFLSSLRRGISLPFFAKKRLYSEFILSHLNYCSIIWNHCGKKNADKLEKINEGCLRFVFNDFHSTYVELLD